MHLRIRYRYSGFIGERCKRALFLAAVLFLAAASFGPAAAARTTLHVVTLDGQPVDPFQVRAQAVVFVFTRSDCPISNRYAPVIDQLGRRFGQQIAFWLVYLDNGESAERIRRHLAEYGLSIPVLRDPRHDLVRLTEVTVTPEAAVFRLNSHPHMVYRGRIDNQYAQLGKSRPEPSAHDLRDVLQAISEGKTVAYHATPAVGCFISDLQ